MRFKPDIVITDEVDVPVALVVVKALEEEEAQEATSYMRGLLEYGPQPPVRYVLLITTDTGFVWPSVDAVLREEEPSFTFPMEHVIKQYLRSTRTARPIGDLVLEGVARGWFWSLVDGIADDEEAKRSLEAAGFLDAVRGGDVRARALA